MKSIQAIRDLIEAADNGEWHNSEDCRIEQRYNDCQLCQALAKAKPALDTIEFILDHAQRATAILSECIDLPAGLSLSEAVLTLMRRNHDRT